MIIIEKAASGSDNIALIVALIALVGVLANSIIGYINTNKSIKADVVSKARIGWIEKERAFLSEYISLSSNMYSYYSIWVRDGGEEEKFLNYCKEPVRFQNLKNLLLISLGPDDGKDDYNNEDFIKIIEELYDITRKNMVSNQRLDGLSKQQSMEKELTEFARNYFKNEWKKAKEGK
ncbi:hypothetical protein GH811_17520 [Acetobacterium malicum]|uniref:Uncharacterized protein n=1 Tax=Acetobacterium malicum TaxID=52692 RepID=A0ABR6Z2N8_9FIRM|nr:hypothetical protein [Acetobacterium malicum]MBC3901402.1 hypothetical protein [Acetobacterium malicum]